MSKSSAMKSVPDVVLAARAEAATWITQLHGPNRSLELEAGFRRWLAERPENAEEFEGLTEVWDLIAMPSVSRAAPRLERWEQPRKMWPQAAVILLGVSLAAAGVWFYGSDPAYSTAIGEQRVVRLDDGSRISLNSDTRLEVDYGDTERRIYLKKGEAYFEVAPNPERSFVVNAGNEIITALGTAFVVRYDADRTVVTLVEGKVAVSEALEDEKQTNRQSQLLLTPGQRLTLAKNAVQNEAPKIDTPRIEAVIAWRRGEVMLDDTPLADAVAEMNRYDKTAIVIDDPAIAGLNVSGLYHTGDSEGFARSVAKMYRLGITEADGRIHLTRPTSP